jgi:hypothetical protein
MDSRDRVLGRDNILSNIPKRMMKRTANVKAKTLPTSQKALDLWMIILKIVKDVRVPVKFSWVKFGDFAMEYAAGS